MEFLPTRLSMDKFILNMTPKFFLLSMLCSCSKQTKSLVAQHCLLFYVWIPLTCSALFLIIFLTNILEQWSLKFSSS